MLKPKVIFLLAVVVLFGTLAIADPALGDYVPGFTWDRAADYWTVSPTSNPGPDSEGNLAWHYEYAQGDGLYGANPWYAQGPTAMVWDSAWQGNPAYGLWTANDDNFPAIDRGLLYQSTRPLWLGDWRNSPVVRWANPTGSPVVASVQGSVTMKWSANANMDVELVIAEVGAGGTDWLYRQTVSRPIGSDSQVIPLSGIVPEIDADGSILLSIRSVSASDQAAFVALYDRGMDIVQVSQIPEPGTMALLAVGGGIITMSRRRRRRA